jgi:hypothetical protein
MAAVRGAVGFVVPLLAVVVTACGSGDDHRAGASLANHAPQGLLEFDGASALAIAGHIPGCADPVPRTPRTDFDHEFKSMATCTVEGSRVVIDAQVRNPNTMADVMPSPGRYIIAGAGWSVSIYGDEATAQAIAKALGVPLS